MANADFKKQDKLILDTFKSNFDTKNQGWVLNERVIHNIRVRMFKYELKDRDKVIKYMMKKMTDRITGKETKKSKMTLLQMATAAVFIKYLMDFEFKFVQKVFKASDDVGLVSDRKIYREAIKSHFKRRWYERGLYNNSHYKIEDIRKLIKSGVLKKIEHYLQRDVYELPIHATTYKIVYDTDFQEPVTIFPINEEENIRI